MKLNELAVKFNGGFNISREQFDIQIREFGESKLIRQLSPSLTLNKKNNFYFLEENGKILSYCVLTDKKVNNDDYLNLEFIAANPSIKAKNGLHLLWSLYITINKDILIGGAISVSGLKLIKDFFRRNSNSTAESYSMIHTKTGEKEQFNWKKYETKNWLSLIIECGLTEDKYIFNTPLYVFERIE